MDTSYNNHLDVVVYESVCMPLVIHVNWVVIGRWLIRHPLLSKKFARRGQKKWENRKTEKTRKPRKLRNRDIPEVRKQKMLALWRRVNFEGLGLGWGCVDARRTSYVVDASNVFFGTFPKMRHPRKQILAFTTTSWIMRLPLKRKHDILYAFSKMQQIPRFHLKSITFHRTQNQMPTLLCFPNWSNRSFPGTRKGFQRIGGPWRGCHSLRFAAQRDEGPTAPVRNTTWSNHCGPGFLLDVVVPAFFQPINH